MQRVNLEINFWETPNKYVPVAEFVFNLDSETQQAVSDIIDFLEVYGHVQLMKAGFIKQLNAYLYELKIENIGILFTFNGTSCWLLHAYTKKSILVPKKELNIAVNRALNIKE